MAIEVLATLNEDDLHRWRVIAAQYEVLEKEGVDLVGLGLDEACSFIRVYWELAAELLEKYDVRGEEAIRASISPVSGQIFLGEV